MSNMLEVIAMMKASLECDVYTGEIPESQSNPAVLVANLANLFDRTLSGRKVEKSSTWRITVVAKAQIDVESILDKLEDLDNTCNTDFQRIFTNLVNTELGLNEQPFRRAFVDLTVY